MARRANTYLFFAFLSLLTVCSLGTLVGVYNTQMMSGIAGIYVELPSIDDFAEKELGRKEEPVVHVSHRELMDSIHPETTLHDVINPATVFPTPPSSTPPLTTPPGSLPPTIITVPSTNPVTVTPTSPTAPVQIPSTTPVPTTNPENTPPPTPIPGPQPQVPVPVTNPMAPPATTNAPGNPGQSWCVAKGGELQTALQAALDYACGIGGADCSQLQQGASCYSPESLENHASYAFNSYYQKHPGPTSCDFGGTAMITNANPSTGSCIYPSSSSAASSTTPPATTVSPPMPTTPPTTSATPPPTTISPPKSTTPSTAMSPPTSPGSGISGSGFPPMSWNNNPTSGFGLDSPPSISTTDSGSADLQPFIGCIILITSIVTGKLLLRM